MYLPAAPLLLVLFQLPTRIEALPNFNIFSRNTTSRGGTALADEFPTEAEVTRGGIAAPVTHAVTSILTAIYGSTLLLHPGTFPAQVQVITMMRATGFDKIEAATIKARQNFRQATSCPPSIGPVPATNSYRSSPKFQYIFTEHHQSGRNSSGGRVPNRGGSDEGWDRRASHSRSDLDPHRYLWLHATPPSRDLPCAGPGDHHDACHRLRQD